MGFGERVAEGVARAGTPLVIGIDLRPDDVPPGVDVSEYQRFLIAVAAEEPRVAGVKLQSAFYERLGAPRGSTLLLDAIRYARHEDLITIVDAKRGDIGPTAEAYAEAYLGTEAPLAVVGADAGDGAADALTVNPYLGRDSLEPFVRVAERKGRGVFVLVRTSNPGALDIQELHLRDGRRVYERVAELVEGLAAPSADASGYGAVGAVVGATIGSAETAAALRKLMPHCILLVPGIGAQGGRAEDLSPFFDARGGGALVPVSRAILGAWRDRNELHWKDAIRTAVRRFRDDIARAAQ